MDYEVQRSARHCSVTGREFGPGEVFYSVLTADGATLNRTDYSPEAWQGPPAECVGWWKSQIPDRNSARKHWAPNDVMLQFWEELAEQPDRRDMRYVLTLLLVRRRVFRLEEEGTASDGPDGQPWLAVYCPRRETTYRVPVVPPDPQRVETIQEELAAMLR
ncbi:MAG: hypothetical protein ABFC77_11130 [Thermoguttaceae bacterium]